MLHRYKVTVGDKIFDVSVEALGMAAAHPGASAGGLIPVGSPLAGKVIAVNIQSGAHVHEGERIATLESMKTSTYVYAPCSGTVDAVAVQPGDSV